MTTQKIFFASLLLITLGSSLFVYLKFKNSNSEEIKENVLVFENKGRTKVKIEIADEPEELKRGLMYRETLNKDSGMLFIFANESIYSFWMKNTLIPLDMIFISKDKKVIDCLKDIQPCKTEDCPTYGVSQSSLYVLEVNAGFCDQHNIVNDTSVNLTPWR